MRYDDHRFGLPECDTSARQRRGVSQSRRLVGLEMDLRGPPARSCGEPHKADQQSQNEVIRLLRGEVPRIESWGQSPRELHRIARYTEPNSLTRGQHWRILHGCLQHGTEGWRAAKKGAKEAQPFDASLLSEVQAEIRHGQDACCRPAQAG
ncbi:MAG TPA: hypothetical protein VMW56_11730 [Candidatus Margulisiibacteriota bacterium]|nr:hypothetical protein [Candidatus Margulisiibacteriota bacterium]